MLWLRAIIVYPLVVLLIRFLGRDLQFQSRPFDQAVQVLLGSAAANLVVIQDIEIWRAFLALSALVLMHTAMSFLSLWNPIKKFLVGAPDVVMENGQILKANLIKHQLSVDELVAGLREKGFHQLEDVEFALLEASGRLSVIPRSQARHLTPKDLHLPTEYEGLATTLIVDGQVSRQNLRKLGLDESWLMTQLVTRGLEGPSDVLYAALDTQGEIILLRDQDTPLLKSIWQGALIHTEPGHPLRVGPKIDNLGPH